MITTTAQEAAIRSVGIHPGEVREVCGSLIRTWQLWAALAAGLAACVFLGTAYPLDFDSVNLALGIVDRFDTGAHQPHPPGYFFHIMVCRAVNTLVVNPFRTLELVNLLNCMLLVVAAAVLRAGPGMLLLAGSFPLVLCLPATPSIYGSLLGPTALVAALILGLETRRISPVALVAAYGAAIGFRQDLSLFLGPAVLYAVVRAHPSPRQWLLMAGTFGAVTLAWFAPTWRASARSPLDSSYEMFQIFGGGSSLLMGAPLGHAVPSSVGAVMHLVSALGPGGLVFLIVALRRMSRRDALWIALGTVPNLFFTIFIHGPKPGYYGVALGFFTVWALAEGKVRLPAWALALCVAANLAFFAWVPPPAEYTWERHRGPSLGSCVLSQWTHIGACGLRALREHDANMRCWDARMRGFRRVACRGPVSAECFRITSYMARHVWHAEYLPSPDSADGLAAVLDRGDTLGCQCGDMGAWAAGDVPAVR